MNGFFVRTAGERDLVAVSALLEETWHAAYDAIYGPEHVAEITASWHTVQELRPRLTRPQSEFLVADDGTALAGMAFAAASGEGRTVLVHQLYVRPALQRQGIGGELLAEVEASFPLAQKLRVEVEEANGPGIAFYRHCGFTLVGPASAADADPPSVALSIYEKSLG